MDTRNRIENLEYMDVASMEYYEFKRKLQRGRDREDDREKPPPGLKGRALGSLLINLTPILAVDVALIGKTNQKVFQDLEKRISRAIGRSIQPNDGYSFGRVGQDCDAFSFKIHVQTSLSGVVDTVATSAYETSWNLGDLGETAAGSPGVAASGGRTVGGTGSLGVASQVPEGQVSAEQGSPQSFQPVFAFPALRGMWYRDRSKREKRERKEDQREPCIELSLDRGKEMAIRQIVDSIGTPLTVPVQTHIPERVIKRSRKNSRSRSRSRSKSPEEIRREIKKEPLEDEKPMTIGDKYKHLEESAFKRLFLRSITGSMSKNVDNALQMKSKLSRERELDRELLEDLREKQSSEQYLEMQEFRRKLPAWEKREELLHMIENNQIIVISGETGCGKTTQVAQFILDNEIERGRGSMCHVVCTQPRRISAISVAERVADERNETVGDDGAVGYTIRLESHPPRKRGSILYCTTGVLLRMLEEDPALTAVSHLILDEIHERDTISDFAITILKDIIPKRPDLRLILMSATLNADHFSQYYNNCPTVNIPGFTFPVQEFYLEDVLQMTRYIPKLKNNGRYQKFRGQNPKKWRMKPKEKEEMLLFRGMVHPYLRELTSSKNYSAQVIDFLYNQDSEELSLELVTELIKYIDRTQGEGAILVFLPGWDKISTLNRMLTQEGLSERAGYLVIPLHSMLSTVSQKSVFNRPPRG
ncbi:hypothetical protein J6590_030216, partial [Homalodisca vitripennis]